MLTFLVITPVLIAVFLYKLSTNFAAKVLAIIFQTALTIAALYVVLLVRDGNITVYVGAYDGVLGIVLQADPIGAAFTLFTAFIFLLVAIYKINQYESRTFWFLLFLLEAVLIGLFFTRDLFNVFVLAEVSTLVMTMLLMYNRQKRNMFYGMVFLMLNVVAMQFYLIGLGYIYRMLGTLDMAHVGERMSALNRADLVLPYALIMTTIAFKCALIPFFSWTPKVRVYPSAPTGVMAILSGVHIKGSLYLFIRFQDLFGVVASQEFFIVIGIIAGLFGAFMAICQTDLRMILAYHTISQAGLIIIGVSGAGEYSFIGGLYHIFSHAMFKTPLFLLVGIIAHSYGSTDANKVRGVFSRMPVASLGGMAAVLGITGAPFFIGSISKYFITHDVPLVINAAAILISLGTIISFIKFSQIFFGKCGLTGDVPEAEKCRTAAVLIFGCACLLGGVFGVYFIDFLFHAPVSVSILSYAQKFGIFAVSVAVGVVVYNKLVKGKAALVRFGAVSFGFKSVCAAIGAFFAIIAVTTYILY